MSTRADQDARYWLTNAGEAALSAALANPPQLVTTRTALVHLEGCYRLRPVHETWAWRPTAVMTGDTTVNPADLTAYNRGVERARRAYAAEQAKREHYCPQCGRGMWVADQHRVCWKCRRP